MGETVAVKIAGVNDLRRHLAPLDAELTGVAARVIASAWLVLGREVGEFEQRFAAYCGVAHCVGVANGTDAIELGLKALGVGPGMRVATVANAGAYGSTAILAAGATPVYVDIDPRTCLMSPAALVATLAHARPHAVIATHLYGAMADMAAILAVADEARIPVIEDCAQAHGASRGGGKAGSFGALGTFSFYPTKNLGALGDGGAIVTDSSDLATRARQLRQYGWTRRYHAEVPAGRNSRLDELQAAVLSALLPRLDAWNARRREIAARYTTELAGSCGVVAPRVEDGDVAHLYVVRARDRDRLREHLRASGIPTDVHFPLPDYRQPGIAACLPGAPHLEETERACAEVVTLPCFPELTDDEVAFVVERVQAWR